MVEWSGGTYVWWTWRVF